MAALVGLRLIGSFWSYSNPASLRASIWLCATTTLRDVRCLVAADVHDRIESLDLKCLVADSAMGAQQVARPAQSPPVLHLVQPGANLVLRTPGFGIQASYS